jgi:selenocysteine lyase/cysteine desulfurase
MEFLLDPDLIYLNHGGYGACPAPVFARYQELQRVLERNPTEFLGRRFHERMAEARAALAGFVGARPEDLVFVPNATAGLNAVIRSLRLEPEDEVLTTRHEYGAVTRTWEFTGANLVFAEFGADIYAGNCHKWLCAPKGAAFLWARPEHQRWVEPLVVSWGYGAEATFAERHGWQGTRDPAAALAVPAAIEAHGELDLERCRRLAASFHDRLPPYGRTPAPQMWASEVATDDPDALQRRLLEEHRIEVVVGRWEGKSLLRVSIAPYNEGADVERLLEALAGLTAPPA